MDAYHDPKTLRDELAMAALTGLLSASKGAGVINGDELARNAYRFADAMLAARKP